MTALHWTDIPTEELERHYNPRIAVPHCEDYGAAREHVNTAALSHPRRVANIPYGQGSLMDLDIYAPSGPGPHPVHIFIHGGYWRSRAKEDFAFIGAALAEQGMLGVILNYPLCPAVTLDAVVEANRTAFAWVCQNIAKHFGDPEQMTLSGHSAGGHLGAAIIAHDWSEFGLPENPLKGAVLISGIFDPTPTQQIAVNAEIGITADIAERHNYNAHLPALNCPVHVIVGGDEPPGWIAQSADHARHLQSAGLPTEYTVSTGENHFSIQDQYSDPGSDVMSAIRLLHKG